LRLTRADHWRVLQVPVNEWGLIISSIADGTRPTIAMGTSITPAQNAYGSYSTLISGASLTDDVYEIEICVCNVAIGGTARDSVAALGIDPAGGTSFTKVTDLVCGPAAGYTGVSVNVGGYFYRFPYFIKAGTSIGMAMSVNSATVTSVNAFVRCRCRPSRPDLVPVGKWIDSYGVTLASSNGTGITPGTTSEGTLVALGTASRAGWWVEFGYGCNNSAMQAGIIDVDLAVGNGSNLKFPILNHPVADSSSDSLSKRPGAGRYCLVANGDILYGRAQTGATLETGHSMAAYVVGG
jgi:hypothetical protein